MNIQRFTLVAFVSFLFFACAGTEKEIEVESIAISQPDAEMEIGETLSLKAEVFPSNATYDGMTWTSTRPKVASVSESGLVSALSEGMTTVTVMAGGKTASCSVTVVKGFVAVTSINLDKASLEMVEGDTETLTASVLPDDATDKTVTWTSSDERIATVRDGVVSALSPGEATVTAQAGDKTGICLITVQKRYIAVESVELDKTELSLFVDESATLTATVKPDDATDQSVSWKSSNEKVARVSSSGEIQAIGVGKATITVTTMDGGKTASCSVVVKNRVESITITAPNGAKEISIGSTLQLKVTVTPEGLSDTETEWKSSDTSVATVSADGLVTAKSKGTVTITVTVKNGSETRTATYEITVLKPVTKVTVIPATLELFVGDEIEIGKAFSVTVEPVDADYSGFKYSTSTPGIISVSEGKIEGVKAGSVTLYITPHSANPNNLKAEVKITVKAKVEGITIQGGSTQTVQVKKTLQLKASITPSNASQEVTWSSSKPAVATVDANGLVTGVTAGTTVITATSKENPSIKATCTVRVENVNIPVSSVELDRSSLSLTKGGEYTLNATVKPDDATDKTVSWRSSNTSVATVDSNGKIKAIAGGSSTITATAGGVSAKCSVTVSVPVTSVSLNKTSLNLMVGDTETLSATIYPSDATNKNVTWKSSNTSVATVQSGKVSAVGVGTAQITVTTNNGSKKATCTVTVSNKTDDYDFTIQTWLLNPDYILGNQDELNPTNPVNFYTKSASPWNKDMYGWGAVAGRVGNMGGYDNPIRSGLTEHFLEYMVNFRINSESIYTFTIMNYGVEDVDWEVVSGGGSYGTTRFPDGSFHAYVQLTGAELIEVISDPAITPYVYLTTDSPVTHGYDVLIEVQEKSSRVNESRQGYYFVIFKGLDFGLKLYDVKLGTFPNQSDYVYAHELVEGIYNQYYEKLFEWKNGAWVVTPAAEVYGITDTYDLVVEVKSVLTYPWDTEESFGGNLFSFYTGDCLLPLDNYAKDSGICWWSNGLNLQVDKKARYTIVVEYAGEMLAESSGTVLVLAYANSIHPLHTTGGSVWYPISRSNGWLYAVAN